MILIDLSDSAGIEKFHPLFRQLFDFVKTHNLATIPAGRIKLRGKELFINVSDARLLAAEEQKLEVHRDYIDVHFPLSGDEIVGWRPLHTLTQEPDAPFDTEADFALYSAEPSTYLTVRPGQCLVVFPEDAHAPIIGSGTLRKLIAKVRL